MSILYWAMLCSVSLQAQESLSYFFEENKGQWDAQVKFKVNIPTGELYLEETGWTFVFIDREKIEELHEASHQKKINAQTDFWIKGQVVKVEALNANPAVRISGKKLQKFHKNYYLGNDPSRWASNVAVYNEVIYENIYDGIDLRFYEKNGSLKYDFIVKPSGDAKKIALKYSGHDKLKIDEFGKLKINTQIAPFYEDRPYTYQGTQSVESRFKLKGDVLSFELGNYNPTLPLIIDPNLIFSSFSGSFSDNFGFTATYDSKGFLYTGGCVFGAGYSTTPGAFQVNFNGGNIDVSITKFDTTGTSLIYSTYLGGNGSEIPHSMVVNNYDELFVFGTTGSSNFPTSTNAFQPSFAGGTAINQLNFIFYPNGCDMFITKFNANGTALLGSTYLGGSGNDGFNIPPQLNYNYADLARGEIEIDNFNNIYIASCTQSTNFPGTNNGFQPSLAGGQDGIIAKLDNTLSTLIWSSYIGGTQNDAVYSIDVDAGNIVVAGGTNSNNFPTSGSFFNTFNGGQADGFIAKISADGSTLLNSIFIGSPEYDQVYFVERDKQKNVYVFGQTRASGNTFIQNVGYSVSGGGQFVRKYNPNLNQIIWSTAFGTGNGTPDIAPSAFLVDVCNKIYLSGWGGAVNNGFVPGSTTNGLPVTPDAFQSSTDGSDFYLMVLEDDASAIAYATYFGGNISAEHVDGGTSRFNRKGEIYQSVCAGCGNNNDFPTSAGAFSSTNNSNNCNNAVLKFKFDFPKTVADFSVPPAGCAPATVQFTNTSIGATNYLWNFGDGNTSTSTHPSHTYTQSGVYDITLVAIDNTNQNCNATDTITRQVIILSNTSFPLQDVAICGSGNVVIGIPPTGDNSVTFQWIPTTGLSSENISNPIASPTQTTTYQLVMSAGSCTDTLVQTVFVEDLSPITLNNLLICPGENATLGPSNPGAGISYQWFPSNAVSNAEIANPSSNITSATTFTLIRNVGLCSDTTFQRVEIVGDYSLKDTSMCKGGNVEIGPDSFFDDWNFSWISDPDLSATNVLNPIASPTNTTDFFFVINNGTCSDTLTVRVEVIGIPEFDDADTSVCPGSQFQPTFVDTSGTFSFLWSPDTFLSSTTLLNPTITPLEDIVYNLIISNQQCRDTIKYTVNIVEDERIVFPDTLICRGDAITIGPWLSYQGFSFSWSPPAEVSNANIKNPSVQPFDNSIYTLIVSNGTCSDTLVFPVNVIQNPFFAGNDAVICLGDNVQLGPNLASDALTYTWTPTDGLNNPNIANPVASPTQNTSYILIVQGPTSNCSGTDWVNVDVIPRPGVAGFNFIEFATCFGYFVKLINNGEIGNTYEWLVDGDLIINQESPEFTFDFDKTISISMIADNNVCIDTITVSKQIQGFDFYFQDVLIPNVFTPFSTPGVNDCFAPIGLEERCYEMYIYNRWGRKIFDSVILEKWCWEGFVNDTQNRVVDGVYFYIIKVGNNEFHGTVTVVR